VEVRRKNLTRRVREDWMPWLKAGALVLAAGALGVAAARFLFYSPALLLTEPEQVEVTGNQHVARAAILGLFAPDRNRSLLRAPLDLRRAQIETIPWVEHARVMRVLPNRIRVELVERQPVAFLRAGFDLGLIDAQGVILERPVQGEFRLPVVSGLSEAVPRGDRESRMKLFAQFLTEIESVRPSAADLLSEVDLSSAEDLRATMTGLPGAGAGSSPEGETAISQPEQAVLVHFGAGDFAGKFRLLIENLSQWQAQAGRVASIDLRFKKQVVVNPEPAAAGEEAAGRPPTNDPAAKAAAKHPAAPAKKRN
jgi:cell division protein FtsQ